MDRASEDTMEPIFTSESQKREQASRRSKWLLASCLLLGFVGAVGYFDSLTKAASKGDDLASLEEEVGETVEQVDYEVPERLQDTTTTTNTKPHIILYTIDDMGWNDMGYQSTDIPGASPFMNDLKKKSVVFDHYYTQPSCTPSRSTIMSGKFVHKTGFQNIEVQHSYEIGLPLSMKLMPEHMKELGYRTHALGKWNVGHCSEHYLPHMRGFNTFLGYMCPGHGYYDHICGMNAGVRDMLYTESEKVNGETVTKWRTGVDLQGQYDTKLYRDSALETVRHHATNYADEPMFMWFAQHGVHGFHDSNPEPPEDMLTADNKAYIESLRATEGKPGGILAARLVTATLVMTVDNTLEDLVATLEEVGMMNNTFLMVHSDNGGDPDYYMGHPGNNYPYRGEKFFYQEGAIRVPAFLYAPGFIAKELQGTHFSGLLHHVDLLTTFVALAGGDALAEDEYLDGIDFMPAVTTNNPSLARSEIAFSLPREGSNWKEATSTDVAALRVGDYKIIINGFHDKVFEPIEYKSSEFLLNKCDYSWYSYTNNDCTLEHQLYNLEEDPFEDNNLFYEEEYSHIKAAMIKRIKTLLEKNPYNYGKIMHEAYLRGVKNTTKYDAALEKSDWWIVPWNCDVVY